MTMVLYKIEIHCGRYTDLDAWLAWFRPTWDGAELPFSPTTKDKRVQWHDELLEWMPLYVGKAKRVGAHVIEHITLDAHKPTTALKLKARPGMQGQRLLLSAIEIRVDNYDLVMPRVESVLRDLINPLVGRQ